MRRVLLISRDAAQRFAALAADMEAAHAGRALERCPLDNWCKAGARALAPCPLPRRLPFLSDPMNRGAADRDCAGAAAACGGAKGRDIARPHLQWRDLRAVSCQRDASSGAAKSRADRQLAVLRAADAVRVRRMAVAGVGFAALAGTLLPPLVALGFIYLGCLPSTIQSATSYTSLAQGNVALAVVGAGADQYRRRVYTAPPLFALLGGGGAGDIGSEAIIRIGLILVLPFLIGQMVQGQGDRAGCRQRTRIVWLDRAVIALAVLCRLFGCGRAKGWRGCSRAGLTGRCCWRWCWCCWRWRWGLLGVSAGCFGCRAKTALRFLFWPDHRKKRRHRARPARPRSPVYRPAKRG